MNKKSLRDYLLGVYAGEILAALDYSQAYEEADKYHL